MTGSAIPVAVHGFTWTSALVGLLNVLIGGALVAVIKKWPEIMQRRNERSTAEDNAILAGFTAVIEAQKGEIARLVERVDKLEQEARIERERHAAEVRRRDADHEAELSLQRHATRNAKQVLYGFLDLIEAKPDDAAATAAKMRKRMDDNDRAEADEAARIRGSRIIAAAKPEATPPS